MESGLSASMWSDLLAQIRLTHPQVVRAWFTQLAPTALRGGVLAIRAANGAQARYLENHCRNAFSEAAMAATGRLVSVEFAAEQDDPADAAIAEESAHLRPRLMPELTFDNFVTGPCNRLAHASSLAVARDPGRTYNPLFLYGSVGLGKTHLLQAICHQVTAAAPERRCFYLSCETFANDYMEAFEQGAMHRFRQRYREADLLVIDDIQFLSARERSQEEFFHTFNTLVQAGKQIVLSADCSPGDIPRLEQRLISRFHSGLVSVLDRPCLETRIAIVRRKAAMRCIEVADDVVQLIASRIDGNVRELEGALTRLDAMSQAEEKPITFELARRAIGEGSLRTPPIAAIMEVVAGRMEVSVADLQSKKRAKSVTLPRHVCMYVTREVTQRSFEEIGGFFGGRDHTTVLHAHRTIAERLDTDHQLRSIVHEIVEDVRRTAH